MATELKLPDVGDNIEKGTVVTVLVNPGDSVSEGQPIIEIETDKAVVEVPASAAGTIEAVNVKVGDTISVGGVIATLGGEAGQGSSETMPLPPQGSMTGQDNVAEPDSNAASRDAATAQRVAQAQQDAQKEQAGQATDSKSAAPAPQSDGGQSSGGSQQVTLPDVGDNIEKGTVVTILVGVGDAVSEGQPVIELETDKAVVEVPANASGTVQSVAVKIGDTIPVGGTILTLSGAAPAQAAAAPTPAAADAPAAQPQQGSSPEQEAARPAGAPQAQAAAPQQSGTQNPQTFDGRPVVPAAPSVRRLAREIGIDIHAVHGTGIAGRISEEDVRRTAGTPSVPTPSMPAQAPTASAAAPASVVAPLPNFEKWGSVRREDMSGIRKATVRSMTTAWTTIPMVTHFDKADVTAMEETRKRFGARVEKEGGKLTMTHILMKVVANALRKFPKFNASLDLGAERVASAGFVAAAALTEREPDLERSIRNAGPLLEETVADVVRRVMPSVTY